MKKVYTEQVVDHVTGEVKQSTKIYERYSKASSFMCLDTDSYWFADLVGSELKVMIGFVMIENKRTHRVNITKEVKQNLAKNLNLCVNQIENAIRGLIQKGKILKIDTPENIINNYEKVIYDVQAKNTHGLIHDLKNYPNQYSVYAFGEFVHYIDKNATFNPNDLQTYLKNKNHTDIIIKPATITIEDVFMDL